MRKPTIELDGDSKVAVVRLKGDRRNPEPEAFRIVFPGGMAEVTRTTDGDYWVHAICNHEEHGSFVRGEDVAGEMTQARLDSTRKHSNEMALGDFADPGLYHVAVRVSRRPPAPAGWTVAEGEVEP